MALSDFVTLKIVVRLDSIIKEVRCGFKVATEAKSSAHIFMERLCQICFWFRYGPNSAIIPANITVKMNLSLQKYWTKGVDFVIPSSKILSVFV